MKTYVSQVFPATHPRKGESTNFKVGLLNQLKLTKSYGSLPRGSLPAEASADALNFI